MVNVGSIQVRSILLRPDRFRFFILLCESPVNNIFIYNAQNKTFSYVCDFTSLYARICTINIWILALLYWPSDAKLHIIFKLTKHLNPNP